MKYFRFPFLFAFLTLLLIPANAVAKDEWIQVTSKNFFLIGNASEKEIRKVGTKLEQFRESFRLLFSGSNLTSPIPTNVVVFKSDSSYKPFKPKRADGKIDDWIAGYFQPGEDVNYITLSTGGEDAETYGTIFHEYVHFIINTNFGRSDVPQWFNEGLAEYYQTFEIADDIKVKLGLPQGGHLNLLQQSKLMPLEQLLKVTNYQLHQTGGHSRSIFYAQSWALVHYLTQGGRSEDLTKYLDAVVKGVDEKTAFESAFKTTYAAMEKELRSYVSKNTYRYHEIKFKMKLDFDTGMVASPLDEAHSNAYLGDLLYHSNRSDDAEPYLATALKLNSDLSMANTALGMVKIKQRKFDDARTLLEKAIAGDPRNHLALYRFAFLLSREGRDEFGFSQKFDPATAAKMRDSLRKAIAINPAFTESYEMLAFVSLVNNDELDEAAKHLQTALKYQPGNQRYQIRLSEILSRQRKFDEAKNIAAKVEANAIDDEAKMRAGNILLQIRQQQETERLNEAEKKRYEAAIADSGGKPRLSRRDDRIAQPSAAEMARLEEDQRIRSMNEALRVPESGEKRVIGRIEKIDCKKRPIVYSIKMPSESFLVTSRDFNELILTTLDPDAANAAVGCDADLRAFNTLLTYRETSSNGTPRGQLVAVEFVPANFRIMTTEEMAAATPYVYDTVEIATPGTSNPPSSTQPVSGESSSMPTPAEMESRRREMMMQSIRDALTKPKPGEKREIGFLDRIECSDKTFFFHIRTAAQTLKLRQAMNSQPRISIYVSDLGSSEFGCTSKSVEFPAVVTYTDKPDKKSKSAGEILALEFVPKTFTIDP